MFYHFLRDKKLDFINAWNEGRERRKAPSLEASQIRHEAAHQTLEQKMLRSKKLKELLEREKRRYACVPSPSFLHSGQSLIAIITVIGDLYIYTHHRKIQGRAGKTWLCDRRRLKPHSLVYYIFLFVFFEHLFCAGGRRKEAVSEQDCNEHDESDGAV